MNGLKKSNRCYFKHNILWFNVGELVEIVVGIWYSFCRKSVMNGPGEMVEISVSWMARFYEGHEFL